MFRCGLSLGVVRPDQPMAVILLLYFNLSGFFNIPDP